MDLNVVLFEPEIPQNTGSVGRLCLATKSTLHLIEPLGFEITESKLKRAGLDYWEHLNVVRHASLEAFLKPFEEGKIPLSKLVLIETRSGNTHFDHPFEPGSYLVFGKETTGLPDWVQNRYPLRTFRIPMFDARVRSLNLSNSVGIVVYEAIRQNLVE